MSRSPKGLELSTSHLSISQSSLEEIQRRAASTDADKGINTLLDWSAAFGAQYSLNLGGPTHFKNETLRLLTEGLRTRHHFTLTYCQWSTREVELPGKELLRFA